MAHAVNFTLLVFVIQFLMLITEQEDMLHRALGLYRAAVAASTARDERARLALLDSTHTVSGALASQPLSGLFYDSLHTTIAAFTSSLAPPAPTVSGAGANAGSGAGTSSIASPPLGVGGPVIAQGSHFFPQDVWMAVQRCSRKHSGAHRGAPCLT